jgi:hypothetical protein
VERFDCYEGTSAKAMLSKGLFVQGVNFFARKPCTRSASLEAQQIQTSATERPEQLELLEPKQ